MGARPAGSRPSGILSNPLTGWTFFNQRQPRVGFRIGGKEKNVQGSAERRPDEIYVYLPH